MSLFIRVIFAKFSLYLAISSSSSSSFCCTWFYDELLLLLFCYELLNILTGAPIRLFSLLLLQLKQFSE